MIGKKVTLAGFAALLAIPVATMAQKPFYTTGFETDADESGATYSLGDLAGQGVVDGRFGGWTVEGTGLASVVDGPLTPQAGPTYVEQGANSTIVANVTSDASRVLVKAYHNGEGATVPTAPDASVPAAAVIAFKALTAGTDYTVAAWDGGTSTFAEPGTAVALPVGEWNAVLLSLNYGSKRYDIQVNGAPYLDRLGFFDNTIASFNGFRSSTTVGSNIDTVSFHASTGDYDGDGRTDDLEMRTTGGDPLDPNATTSFGDVNGDGDVTIVDALLYFRAVSIPGFPTTGLTLWDINQDTTSTAQDAKDLYSFVIGDPAVPYLPSSGL